MIRPLQFKSNLAQHTDAYRNTAEKLRGLLRGIILRLIHLTAVRNTSGSVFFLILLSKTLIYASQEALILFAIDILSYPPCLFLFCPSQL